MTPCCAAPCAGRKSGRAGSCPSDSARRPNAAHPGAGRKSSFRAGRGLWLIAAGDIDQAIDAAEASLMIVAAWTGFRGPGRRRTPPRRCTRAVQCAPQPRGGLQVGSRMTTFAPTPASAQTTSPPKTPVPPVTMKVRPVKSYIWVSCCRFHVCSVNCIARSCKLKPVS